MEVEKGRYLNFFTKIDAGGNASADEGSQQWLTLDGTMNGLYSQALEIENLHLSQVKLSGVLDYEGNLKNISIYGLGLFGKDCLKLNKSTSHKDSKTQEIQQILEIITNQQQQGSPELFTVSSINPPQLRQMISQVTVTKTDLLNTFACNNESQCFSGDLKLAIDL